MLPFFKRTEAGRAEVAAKAAGLSRSARNLLLVIDDSKPPEQWLASVRGCTETDLFHLSELGLIAGIEKSAAQTPQVESPDTVMRGVLTQVEGLPYPVLYDALNGFGKTVLGVIGGYKFALQVERCSGLVELQDFTRRFVIRIRDEFGLEDVRRFGRHLQKLAPNQPAIEPTRQLLG